MTANITKSSDEAIGQYRRILLMVRELHLLAMSVCEFAAISLESEHGAAESCSLYGAQVILCDLTMRH